MLVNEFGNLTLKSFTLDLLERYLSKIPQSGLSESTSGFIYYAPVRNDS
jgi:hypothetical protein